MSEACEMPTPGPQHEHVMNGVGTWDVDCKHWMDPTQPPMESKATEEVEAVGGFWAVGKFQGEAMGHPFTGVSTFGYDPTRGKYVTTWVDSMMPFLWTMEGEHDEESNTFRFEGEGPDFTGEATTTWRIEFEVVDCDEQIMRMSVATPGGFFTTMENTYRRRK